MTARGPLLGTAAALGAGLLLGATSPVPAHAEASVVTDPSGDVRHVPSTGTGWSDIVKVRATHGRTNLRVRVTPERGTSAADVIQQWVDTDRRDPGPELRVTTLPGEGPAVLVRRVDDWRSGSGTDVRCPGAAAVVRAGVVTTYVPRRCLGAPRTLRVSVAYEIDVHDRPVRRNDWAPGKRRFDRWLVSGPAGR